MEPNKLTYKLKAPFKDDKGFDIAEITLRQATVGDLMTSEDLVGESKNETKRTVVFFSTLSGVSPGSLQGMTLSEWIIFVREANAFLGLAA